MNNSPEAVARVYKQYGIIKQTDRDRIDVIRQSINSPSVGERTVSITVEEGEEKIEMKVGSRLAKLIKGCLGRLCESRTRSLVPIMHTSLLIVFLSLPLLTAV